MGIPKYFRWVTTKHNNLIINPKIENNTSSLEPEDEVLADCKNIDNLFLDANCLIHPCCRQILKSNSKLIKEYNKFYKENCNDIKNNVNELTTLEKLMFDSVINYIIKLYDYVKPKNLLYIAIDGVAPRAKMEQQRTRRYRSYKEKTMRDNLYIKHNEEIEEYWDTNAITPGTTFMLKLSNYLQLNLKDKLDFPENFTLILSDTNSPGEGEHKIVEYIRNGDEDKICCIYGLDADLIMLSLCLKNKTFLLREAVNFGKVDMDELLFLSINLFKQRLQEEIILGIDNESDFEPDERVIIDYVFLCFLLGNDFLPHLVNLDIGEGSIGDLIDIYTKLIYIRKHYLINNNEIQYSFLQQILNQLYNTEDGTLIKFQKNIDRKRAYRKDSNHYSSNLDKDLDMLRFYPLMNKVDYIKLGDKKWRENYYKYYFHINSVHKNEDFINDICKKYLEGLQWNIKYYLEGCCSWKWYYPFRAAPCLRELCQYLNNRIYNTDFGLTKPYTPIQQLFLVIPIHSSHLLPDKYNEIVNSDSKNIVEYYPKDFELDLLNNVWLHECDPIIPTLQDDKILEVINKVNLNKIDSLKNKITNEPIYLYKPDIKRNVVLTIS